MRESMLLKLRQAITQGAALASLTVVTGCAESESKPGDVPRGQAGGDAPADATTQAMADASLPTTPYPLDRLGCWGENHDGGYHGQCCVSARCYTPAAGTGCAAEVPPVELPGGSGVC